MLIIIFNNALSGSPASNSANVSNEKAEKVVNDPSSPTNKPIRHSAETAMRSINKTNRKPTNREPKIFTASVPYGKSRPSNLWILFDMPKRRIAPNAPPPAIANVFGFKLNFATTRGVSLDAGQDGAQKIFMVKVGADPFTIEVQTKTKRARGAWR